MEPDWTDLPANLTYLREPAIKYGPYISQNELDWLWNNVVGDELAVLASIAERVRSPGEAQRIYEWRQQHQRNTASELLAGLVEVLQYVVPHFPDDVHKMDWSDLPEELKFLQAPACEYGAYWLRQQRLNLMSRLTQQEWADLNTLAARVRSNDFQPALTRWYEVHPPFVHGSAAVGPSTLVYLFLDLLDILTALTGKASPANNTRQRK